MISNDPQPIHHADFRLDDDQQAVRDVFSAFFERECPTERVREAEPHGFDTQLWKQLSEMRVAAMGVDVESGGDGAGLVELALVAEQWGKHLAPVPLAEVMTATRLLARVDSEGVRLAPALEGTHLVTFAVAPTHRGARQLVQAASVADAVIALVGDDLVIVENPSRPPVPNQGRAPLAWVDFDTSSASTLASGDEAVAAFRAARRDWQILMAAALVGMADATSAIAIEHARDRIAFGVPIGSFQSVAHPLVDVAMNVEMGRRLVRKAAWWAESDPTSHRELVPMAYYFAEHAAVHATTVGVHTLGGVGFTVESDVQLYFRRAKGWSLVHGDPSLALDEIADELYGELPARRPTVTEHLEMAR